MNVVNGCEIIAVQECAQAKFTLTSARVLSVTSMTNSGAGPLLSSSKKFKMSDHSQGSLALPQMPTYLEQPVLSLLTKFQSFYN